MRRVTKYDRNGEPVWERTDDPNWISPFHEGGVRSGNLDKCAGKQLTDRKIKQYLGEGFYRGDRKRNNK